jgi:D-inositol-3-phosphate glycosyltransferase
MAVAAVEQAAGFAWERTADRTLEVYRMAARAMRDDLEQVGA